MKTILLVEDDEDIRMLLTDLLSHEIDSITRVAINAAQAIEIASSTTFDLLVTNYHLPGTMNGIELYDYLRHISGREQVPAILMSAMLPEEDVAARKIIGIYKPFDLDHLLEQVTMLLDALPPEGTHQISSS